MCAVSLVFFSRFADKYALVVTNSARNRLLCTTVHDGAVGQEMLEGCLYRDPAARLKCLFSITNFGRGHSCALDVRLFVLVPGAALLCRAAFHAPFDRTCNTGVRPDREGSSGLGDWLHRAAHGW